MLKTVEIVIHQLYNLYVYYCSVRLSQAAYYWWPSL